MRLELSRLAQADLDGIRDHSLAEFGAARAIVYLDGIEDAFRRIVRFPGIGAEHPIVRPPLKSVGAAQHRIFYSVEGDAILVIRLLHKAMDVETHL